MGNPPRSKDVLGLIGRSEAAPVFEKIDDRPDDEGAKNKDEPKRDLSFVRLDVAQINFFVVFIHRSTPFEETGI
jgi:hypothetical protein